MVKLIIEDCYFNQYGTLYINSKSDIIATIKRYRPSVGYKYDYIFYAYVDDDLIGAYFFDLLDSDEIEPIYKILDNRDRPWGLFMNKPSDWD